ncbi:methyl-accepting chemotaxis protein [Aquincola sp. MAHUQ-54]|uniref:Methyl-accepting chemotaxis protein n=1 Tax=Aquincola agrisoli TaxID=3119538 RepID=A0AAW9QK00_9BURK
MFRSLRWSLLSIGLAGVAAAVCVLAQALWSFERLNDSAEAALLGKDVVADILPPPMYLIELRLVLSQVVEGTMGLRQAQQQVEQITRDYGARVAYWQGRLPPEIDHQLLVRQHETAERFIDTARQQVLAPLAQGRGAEAGRGLAAADALYRAHRASVDETVRLATDFATRNMAGFQQTRLHGSRTMPLTTLLLVVMAMGCYLLSRRSILAPLRESAAQARAVAAGDLCATVQVVRADEIGALQSALNEMTGQLAHIVGDVRNGIDAIAAASAQIAHGNQDLSARTEQQAGQLQQAASSMDEMACAVRANADRARGANELAVNACGVAGEAGQVVGRVVSTMAEIRDASRHIAEITGVIDGIAFQTNILALNAAVEAARAGEQGRGFAVVAGEVRLLAGRCAEAAKQIKRLVDTSNARVEAGHALVGSAGRTMDDVVAQVQGMTRLIADIAASSGQQDDGVRQMNATVTGLDATTQQNAALVEQTAAAADSLRQQAGRLAEAVTVFRLQAA